MSFAGKGITHCYSCGKSLSMNESSICNECKKEVLEVENEKKLEANSQFYQQLIDEKDKEISWLKSVINGILHI